MSAGTDVAVIGGGIVGLTIALAAAERGLSVSLIDMPAAGSASRAAAGMLAPSLEGMPPHVLPHALAARDYYPAFLEALRRHTAHDVELNRHGILELAESETALELLRARAGTAASVISPSELAALEPSLAPHAGALLHPDDGAVDNVALMAALERAVGGHPRIARIAGRAATVDPSAPSVSLASGQRLTAAWLVVAGGAWAGGLAGLPGSLPLQPIGGQLLSMAPLSIRHVMYAPRTGYLVPRGNRMVVGATTEPAGFTSEATAWGRQKLTAVVARTIPHMADATVVEHWAGLRPMSPDTLPILGADPRHPRLLYACGFSRNGILLAPWAAEQLGELLATERAPDSLDSFSISRFDADS